MLDDFDQDSLNTSTNATRTVSTSSEENCRIDEKLKNRESAQFFTSLFRIRKIHKTYLAVVKGEVPRTLKKMEDILEYLNQGSDNILLWASFHQ